MDMNEAWVSMGLQDAKKWCEESLHRHIKGFSGKFDYSIFRYIIDNFNMGYDVLLDPEEGGIIRVSIDNLLRHERIEKEFEKNRMIRSGKIFDEHFEIKGGTEIDPQSMFVHEITEYLIGKSPETWIHYFSPVVFSHDIAYYIENINRRERNLKLWPLY